MGKSKHQIRSHPCNATRTLSRLGLRQKRKGKVRCGGAAGDSGGGCDRSLGATGIGGSLRGLWHGSHATNQVTTDGEVKAREKVRNSKRKGLSE